jgi:hypothetical protein
MYNFVTRKDPQGVTSARRRGKGLAHRRCETSRSKCIALAGRILPWQPIPQRSQRIRADLTVIFSRSILNNAQVVSLQITCGRDDSR